VFNPNNADEIIFYHNSSRSVHYFHRGDSAFSLIEDFVFQLDGFEWNSEGLMVANTSNRTRFFNPFGNNWNEQIMLSSTMATWGPDLVVVNNFATF
jgi:hypothetical protein